VKLYLDPTTGTARLEGLTLNKVGGLPQALAQLQAQIEALQVADSQAITQAQKMEILLLADTTKKILLPDVSRKGHLIKNLGLDEVLIFYGIFNPRTEQPTEIYQILLAPKTAYLHDFVEVIPYLAFSPNNGCIQVIELF